MPPAAANSPKNPDSVGRRWKLLRHLGSGRSNFAPGHHSFKWMYQHQPWLGAAVLDALPVHEVSGARIRPRAVWIRLLRSGSRQLGRRSPPWSPTPNLEGLMLCHSIAVESWTLTRLASMADASPAIGRRNHVERAVRSIRPQDPSLDGLRHIPEWWPAPVRGGVGRRTGEPSTATAVLVLVGRNYGIERTRGADTAVLDKFSPRSRALR